MRVSFNSSYDRFLANNSNTQDNLAKISKQLSSGKKIEFGQESPSIYVDTLRLDYEITTFRQTKDISEKAQTFSNYTDTTLNEFTTTLENFKSKLLSAGNDIHSVESREAIVKELEASKDHLINLSNTSVNGQYLFSGSSLDTKPVSEDGTYNGNSKSLKGLIGSNVDLTYNIDGKTLFLGQDSDFNKKVTTNIKHYNKTDLYPSVMTEFEKEANSEENLITGTDTIRNLVGDNDFNETNQSDTFFYLRGTKADGTTFKEKFALKSTDTVDDLLQKMEETYGNTATNKIVTASLNEWGEIEIVDNTEGRGKIDFHLVAATDLSGGAGADVNDISTLNGLNIDDAVDLNNGDLSAYNGVLITSFIKSGTDATDLTGATDNNGVIYDKSLFVKENSYLKSNVSQVVTATNAYATETNKISEVAGDLTGKNTNFAISGTDVNGNAINANIDLNNLVAQTPNNDINEVTYQQLLNEVAIALSGEADITTARGKVDVALDDKGRIVVRDLTNVSPTNMEFAMYDTNTDNYGTAVDSTLKFNANNSLTAVDVSTDFFAQLDEAIEAVKTGRYRADGDISGGERNIGLQNAIDSIDHLMKHVEKTHTIVGAQGQAINYSISRQSTMITHAQTLRSQVLDTDIAETSLELNQLTLNYQAMMSTIAKVNSLSLVNYIK